MSSSSKRTAKKVVCKKPMSTFPSTGYSDQRPPNQLHSVRPSFEHGYTSYSNSSYSQPYQQHAPQQPPYFHSTAPQAYYQHRPTYGMYDDHSSYTSLMMQNDPPHQQHFNAKQLEIRDREAMQNLSRQFSHARTDPTTEEISSGSDENIDEDQISDAEDVEEGNEETAAQMTAPPSPEYNKKQKKWKSLSGIFSARRREPGSNEVGVGIEDIDTENADDDIAAADVKKKQVKFTSQQYISLAKSWIRISQDSITGNNMKGQKFWEKVAEYYNTIEPMKRTWGSLRGGYRVMNPACQNYLAILSRLESRQRSGAAPYDIIEEARKAYQQKYGHPFKFQECFELLSELPKWKNPNNYMFEQQNKARRMNYSDSSPGSDHSPQERSPLFGSSDARPIGRNKSLQLEQRSAEFARFVGTLETASNETREHRVNLAAQRERSEMEFRKTILEDRELRRQEKERKEALLRERNYIKLMTCDFSKLCPLQQQLVTEQLEIYKNMRDSGSGSGSGASRDGF